MPSLLPSHLHGPRRGDAALTGVAELARLIAGHVPHEGMFEQQVPGVHLARIHRPYREWFHDLHTPCLSIVAQGAKSVLLGQEIYDYDASRMLVYTIDVPVAGQVTHASASRPHLCFRLDLDPQRIAALTLKAFPGGVPKTRDNGAIQVGQADQAIIDAAVRLIRLLERRDDIGLLAPIIIDEILVRLLLGPMGSRVAQIGLADSALRRIARAVTWIKDHYAQALSIEELAALVHMSPSTFHHHFKSVTSMSPLQYQKTLRLQEARRLMLVTDRDASLAGRSVGYRSASQFSREYSRLFGDAPSRDIARLRDQAVALARMRS